MVNKGAHLFHNLCMKERGGAGVNFNERDFFLVPHSTTEHWLCLKYILTSPPSAFERLRLARRKAPE